jgi:transcriptional antiterminator Rof (Rho-off)
MKYIPVNCGFYDYFEAAITLKQIVPIRYYDADGVLKNITIKPIDLIHEQKEEFLLLENKEMIRLDRIVSFNNEKNPGTVCTFNN